MTLFTLRLITLTFPLNNLNLIFHAQSNINHTSTAQYLVDVTRYNI